MISKTPHVDLFARTYSSIVRSFSLHVHVDSLLSNSGIFVDVSIDDSSREANAITTRTKRIGFVTSKRFSFLIQSMKE